MRHPLAPVSFWKVFAVLVGLVFGAWLLTPLRAQIAVAFFEPNARAGGTWLPAASMATARLDHTATLLPSGQLLVVGGGFVSQYSSFDLDSTELYDPFNNRWLPAAKMSAARYAHTATLLQSGKVLVAGGCCSYGAYGWTSAELYDPASNTWSPAGNMRDARVWHTATLLSSGQVLVAGGLGNYGYMSSAELYDPASNTWLPAGNMRDVRYLHTATLLPSGKVLVVGGAEDSYYDRTTSELYDPVSNMWSPAGNMSTGRERHTATLLSSGKVLVAGGYCHCSPYYLSSAELYDPVSNAWSSAGNMGTAHERHTATALSSGKVLVAGGINGFGLPTGTELYDPASNTWSPAGDMHEARYEHTATLLSSGVVLVAGGVSYRYLASAELYSPNGEPIPTPRLGLENLYVDDAMQGSVVNRQAGDEFRLVAAVANRGGATGTAIITVTLSSPQGTPPLTTLPAYVRLEPPDEARTVPLGVADLGGGSYLAHYTVGPGARVDVVLAFKLGLSAQPADVKVAAALSTAEQYQPPGERSTAFRIIPSGLAQALIVTNRQHLFSQYDRGQAANLLAFLTQVADGDPNYPNEVPALIYNVDWHLGNANPEAQDIRSLIALEAERSLADYLLIVGGPDVVPFYDIAGSQTFVSDGPYADTSGNDYLSGQLELMAGRIVGETADDMRSTLERELLGPAGTHSAVVASTGICRLNARCINLDSAQQMAAAYGISFDSSMQQSETWDSAKLRQVSSAGPFSFFVFAGHSAGGSQLVCPAASCGSTYFQPADVLALPADIAVERPFVGLDGCSLGNIGAGSLDPQRSMTAAWLKRGATAVLAPTTGVAANPYCRDIFGNPALGGGEQWFYNFFAWLATDIYPGNPALSRMRTIGSAWREASRQTATITAQDRLEWVLYGVPWMRPPFVESGAVHTAVALPSLASSQASLPGAAGGDMITRTITYHGSGYRVLTDEGYQWLAVDDAPLNMEHLKPILPRWLGPALVLPPGSAVQGMALVSGSRQSLGVLHLPVFYASTSLNPASPYTDTTSVTGLYPQPFYGYHIVSDPNYLVVQPYVFPAQYEPGTGQTELWSDATIVVTYTLSSQVALSSFALEREQAGPSESVQVVARVDNPGTTALAGLQTQVAVRDLQGALVGSAVGIPFALAGGETQTITLTFASPGAAGPYVVDLGIMQSGVRLAGSSTGLVVSSGMVLGIEAPATVWEMPGGTDVPVMVRYRNTSAAAQTVAVTLRVLNESGSEIAALPAGPSNVVQAGGTADLPLTWTCARLESGRYILAATINSGDTIHGPITRTVDVRHLWVWLPFVRR